jgi:hypothetical protein
VVHGLFSVNSNPDAAGSSTLVVGIYGTHKVAPFKTMMATQAIALLNPVRKGSKKDPELQLPSIPHLVGAGTAKKFVELIGESGQQANILKGLPNSHFIHPRVFLDFNGSREWETSKLAIKIIENHKTHDDSENETDLDDKDDEDKESNPNRIGEVYQLQIYLWPRSKKCGSPVTLREVPETGEVASRCKRKLDTIGREGGIKRATDEPSKESTSVRLTEAMILNLNKSSEAYVEQISKDDSANSSLSRLASDQAALFKLLPAENVDVSGTPGLNSFTASLTESRDPMREINMVRQVARNWGGRSATRAYFSS